MDGFNHPLTYIWVAKYLDSTELKQIDNAGKEHLFSEIDQSRLKEFSWIPTQLNFKTYSIKLNPDQRVIAFKRNFLSVMTGLQTTIYALGFQQTINGQNVKSIIWIGKEFSVIVDDI